MEVLIYEVNGVLHRVVPSPDVSMAVVIKRSIPEGVEFKTMDNDTMPSHVFRNSWKVSADKVVLDIPKAKEIAHVIRREKRDEAMKANIELIQKDAMGIPLKASESVVDAKKANADYKKDIDDVMQTTIDAAKSESGLLGALGL